MFTVLNFYKASLIKTGCIYKLICQFLLCAKTVCNLLLPAKTAVHDRRVLAETVCMILLPAATLGEKQNHKDSLHRKPFFILVVLEGKEIMESQQVRYDSLDRKPKLMNLFIPCD